MTTSAGLSLDFLYGFTEIFIRMTFRDTEYEE